MLVVIDSPSDPIPASTKSIFNIGQLVTTEKRVGVKNLHVVNLLPDATVPLPFHLYGSRGLQGSYLLKLPRLSRRHLKVGMLLPKILSERLPPDKLPRGMKTDKLDSTDLRRIKDHWLKREVRNVSTWEHFIATYDTERVFRVKSRSKGVELPVTIESDACETFMLLFRTGNLSTRKPKALGTLTLTQSSASGEIVGGSTFVLKLAKSR